MPHPTSIGDNIWLLRYPLRLFGIEMGRNVTLMRLTDGRLIVHSTAAFSGEDRAAIESLGRPAWLVEATHFHDTLAKAGMASFPDIPYLAPEGFPGPAPTRPLSPPPEDWAGEVDVIPIGGVPKIREHAFFHRASGTLVLADLLFNQAADASGWSRIGLRLVSGIRSHPGNSRMFRAMIRDREAFEKSLRTLFAFPFQQIVVAHGDPIREDAKEIMKSVFRDLGFDV